MPNPLFTDFSGMVLLRDSLQSLPGRELVLMLPVRSRSCLTRRADRFNVSHVLVEALVAETP